MSDLYLTCWHEIIIDPNLITAVGSIHVLLDVKLEFQKKFHNDVNFVTFDCPESTISTQTTFR